MADSWDIRLHSGRFLACRQSALNRHFWFGWVRHMPLKFVGMDSCAHNGKQPQSGLWLRPSPKPAMPSSSEAADPLETPESVPPPSR